MKKSTHWLFTHWLSLLSVFASGQSYPGLDSIIADQMRIKQTPGLAVAVIRNDTLLHEQVYGLANVEHQVKVKTATVFELASLSKQFISAAMLLLQEDGKVNLSDPISNYLDSLPPKWQQLSLYQLLSHSAGLASMEHEFKSLKSHGWPKYVSRSMLWQSALRDTIASAPGSKFSYHNLGYSLALLVLESVTRQDHRIFFQQRIFDPLSMDHTFFEDLDSLVPNLSSSYTLREGVVVPLRRVGQEEIGVGDGIYSTLKDLQRWNYALNHNLILSTASTNQMFNRISLTGDRDFHYGLGWWLPKRNDLVYYYHNGIAGTEILKIPQLKLDIIVLGNLGQGSFDEVMYWGIANAIAEFLASSFRHAPQSVPLKHKQLKGLTGKFYYESGGDLEIYILNGDLYLTDELGTFKMIHTGNLCFTLEDDPVRFEFMSNDKIRVIDEIWNDDMAYRNTP